MFIVPRSFEQMKPYGQFLVRRGICAVLEHWPALCSWKERGSRPKTVSSACQKAKKLFEYAFVSWILLTSLGVVNVLFENSTGMLSKAGVHQCCCSVAKQRSKNCCCYPMKTSEKSAPATCCSNKEHQQVTSDDDDSEFPQLNSYCGSPAPDAFVQHREPRMMTSASSANPEFCLAGLLLPTDEHSLSVCCLIDPPPPRV